MTTHTPPLKCRRCRNPAEPGITCCRPCQNKLNATIAKWKSKNSTAGACRCGQGKAPGKSKCNRCLERNRLQGVHNFLDALDAYGGRRCACCGEANIGFLTLDHINNDGHLRLHSDRAGNALYRRLKKLGYPPGYQPLCFNCNLGKARSNGVCPHRDRRPWLEGPGSTLYRRRLFLEALERYGGAACACCGEVNPFFLTLDHEAGGGAEHRRSVGPSVLYDLRKRGYPPGLRVLCVNCNSGRARVGGVCPHQGGCLLRERRA